MTVGVAGIVRLFFWVPRSVLQLDERMSERRSRVRLSTALLLVPYLVISALFTVLAFVGHPLGTDGALIVAFQYWFGSFPLGWGFFMASYWLHVTTPPPSTPGLPSRVSAAWSGAAVLALLIAASALLSTLGEVS